MQQRQVAAQESAAAYLQDWQPEAKKLRDGVCQPFSGTKSAGQGGANPAQSTLCKIAKLFQGHGITEIQMAMCG